MNVYNFDEELKTIQRGTEIQVCQWLSLISNTVLKQQDSKYHHDFLQNQQFVYQLVFGKERQQGILTNLHKLLIQSSKLSTLKHQYLDTLTNIYSFIAQLSPRDQDAQQPNFYDLIMFDFNFQSQVPPQILPPHIQIFLQDQSIAINNQHFSQWQEHFSENLVSSVQHVSTPKQSVIVSHSRPTSSIIMGSSPIKRSAGNKPFQTVNTPLTFWIYLLNSLSSFKDYPLQETVNNDVYNILQDKIGTKLPLQEKFFHASIQNPILVIMRRILSHLCNQIDLMSSSLAYQKKQRSNLIIIGFTFVQNDNSCLGIYNLFLPISDKPQRTQINNIPSLTPIKIEIRSIYLRRSLTCDLFVTCPQHLIRIQDGIRLLAICIDLQLEFKQIVTVNPEQKLSVILQLVQSILFEWWKICHADILLVGALSFIIIWNIKLYLRQALLSNFFIELYFFMGSLCKVMNLLLRNISLDGLLQDMSSSYQVLQICLTSLCSNTLNIQFNLSEIPNQHSQDNELPIQAKSINFSTPYSGKPLKSSMLLITPIRYNYLKDAESTQNVNQTTQIIFQVSSPLYCPNERKELNSIYSYHHLELKAKIQDFHHFIRQNIPFYTILWNKLFQVLANVNRLNNDEIYAIIHLMSFIRSLDPDSKMNQVQLDPIDDPSQTILLGGIFLNQTNGFSVQYPTFQELRSICEHLESQTDPLAPQMASLYQLLGNRNMLQDMQKVSKSLLGYYNEYLRTPYKLRSKNIYNQFVEQIPQTVQLLEQMYGFNITRQDELEYSTSLMKSSQYQQSTSRHSIRNIQIQNQWRIPPKDNEVYFVLILMKFLSSIIDILLCRKPETFIRKINVNILFEQTPKQSEKVPVTQWPRQFANVDNLKILFMLAILFFFTYMIGGFFDFFSLSRYNNSRPRVNI